MPRLFSGIKIPASIGQWLLPLQSGLKNARWIETENHHITLRFIGDVDDLTAQEFSSMLGQIRFRPFDLKLKGVGSFGGKKPNVIWAGVEEVESGQDHCHGDGGLVGLQKAHERAACAIGLEPDHRNYAPHVTLLRPRQISAGKIAQYLQYQGMFESPVFEVSQFHIFSARPAYGGGPYLIEESFPKDFDLEQSSRLAQEFG